MADVVIGMINPYKHGLTANYRGYDVDKCIYEGHNRFRMLKVLKNSYGIDDVRIAYSFMGETGLMMELPKSDDITDTHYNFIKEGKFLKL